MPPTIRSAFTRPPVRVAPPSWFRRRVRPTCLDTDRGRALVIARSWRSSRDFHFACPGWHRYTPDRRRAHEILFVAQSSSSRDCHSARADVRPTGAAVFRAFLRHWSTRAPFLRRSSSVSGRRPSRKPLVRYKSFRYQAKSWTTPRRIIAKVEHHRGELFPRVGFIVTNMVLPSRSVVRFYNKRGTADERGGLRFPAPSSCSPACG